MRRFIKRRATENREASPRELPGGYGARARDDERQRASWEAHGCRCLRRASGSKPPWRLAAASHLGEPESVAGRLQMRLRFGGSLLSLACASVLHTASIQTREPLEAALGPP